MQLTQFTKSDRFLMLALDHRESFLKLINPNNPTVVTKEQAVALKTEIIDSLSDQFSGLLIDAEYGLPAYQSPTAPFLLPLERSGYTGHSGERVTTLQYQAAQLKDMGASGAKLLIYFNPDVGTAKEQLRVARAALIDCQTHDLPLFLEIVTYDPAGTEVNKTEVVPHSVQMFLDAGVRPDVFKLQYPGSSAPALTKMLGEIPWIVLTGGQDFATFKRDLEGAKSSGAKGFLAGRALWQEVCGLGGEAKTEFLRGTLPDRFRQCAAVFDD